jgi:hypothetical protein
VILINKKNDLKLEKFQETQIKESGLRIVEAEEALREADARH